ncbi:MAG: sigma-54-dependent Fis family transcriptional regulator, partial [Candidatus Electrothrix sp. AR3]|nr:sigma-54-dependent Fis family transcriptional regulator [Candidatus Electrothrix sp. AR3]
SDRAAKPFIAVNCGGVPENLLESEFFGYVRGAFTGAERNKKGLFQEADGGTLFLDEIGELPPAMQVKLLRVLQGQEVRQVGASTCKKVNVRIMAATSKNLTEEVQAGSFREDFFYRINVINIHIPPLRERIIDLPLLCDHFIKKFSEKNADLQITPDALQILLNYSWPGNVRELENIIERAVVLADKKIVRPENLPPTLVKGKIREGLSALLGTSSIKKGRQIMERQLIAQALEESGGNKSKAARLLEISYPSLLNKIKEYWPESAKNVK